MQRPSEYAPTAKSLAAWRTELENSVRHWEAVIQQFKLKADEAREKLKAVDILLGQSPTPSTAAASTPTLTPNESDKDFTPVYEYWPPILESLVELGGRAQRDKVITLVGEKLEPKLTSADKQLLKSGMDVRWKNRVAWQRLNMVKQGLLRENSPRVCGKLQTPDASGSPALPLRFRHLISRSTWRNCAASQHPTVTSNLLRVLFLVTSASG